MYISFARNRVQNSLIKLRTDNAGQKLRQAVEKSQNYIFLVRLSTRINPDDAHAIDVRYHNTCYVKHVTNVLRTDTLDRSKASSIESAMAAEIEFLGEVEKGLNKGKILTMNDSVIKFKEIRESNGVEQSEISKKQMKQILTENVDGIQFSLISKKKQMKQILTENVDGIQFSKPARLNESETITLKKTSDKAIQALEETHTETDMQNIFTVAKTLRKHMLNVEPWKFSGFVDNNEIGGEHLPNALVIFFSEVNPRSFETHEKC